MQVAKPGILACPALREKGFSFPPLSMLAVVFFTHGLYYVKVVPFVPSLLSTDYIFKDTWATQWGIDWVGMI